MTKAIDAIAALAACSLLISACASPDPSTVEMRGAATDAMGNIYPAECPASIVDDPALQSRIITTRAPLPATLGGTTLNLLVGGKAIVTLNEHLSGWRERDTRRHEDCHALLLLEGKPINWHPHQSDYVPNTMAPMVRCQDVFHC